MECPICGRNVKRLVKAEIEGAIIEVCEDCAKKYGRIISFDISTTFKRKRIKRMKKEIEDVFLVEDYGERIRRKRESLGLTREKFAELLHEKESVIKRIENQEMIPDEKLLRKIEKLLGIELRAKETRYKSQEKNIPPLTLGDVVELR